MSTLSCEEIRERLTGGDDEASLHAHVASCPECGPILSALSELDGDLAALTPIDAPDALVEATLARVREERNESAPMTVGAPSLLGAAFAMLTSALGALFLAPLIFVRWMLGVGTERPKSARASIEDAGKSVGRPRFGVGPVLAMSSALVGVIAVATFTRFGTTVRSKTRGGDAVVDGLPMPTAGEPGQDGYGWWSRNSDGNDEANARGPMLAPPTVTASPTPDPATGLDIDGRFDDWQQADMPAQQPADELSELDDETRSQLGALGYHGGPAAHGTFELRTEQGGFDQRETTTARATRPAAGDLGGETTNGLEDLEQRAMDLPVTHHTEGAQTIVDQSVVATGEGEGRSRDRLLEPAGQPEADREQARGTLRGGRDEDGDDGVVYRRGETHEASGYWALAQRTSGITFASSQSWWANTYVPGDAHLRVLHARLAASPSTLPGSTLSALALAELAQPTVPAVAAPTDRALAIGVHADTTAIEGPTRVRMEIALRAIDQAAGRRGALRIAIVVDARSGLGTEETAHLRALLASLSRSLSPRDRVILTAAGPGGGTLVPLGVLRHGQVEVALRHLGETASSAGEAIPVSLGDALGAGLEAVAGDDDGAGLTLLVTPDGSHDAAVDQALHLGAVAGVPTTAVGIGAAASTSSLDAIALAGEGRRRVVLGDADAARAVREELTAASRLVARALRVRIRLADGVQLVDVVGSHSLDAEETRRTRESERAIDQSLARRLGIGQDRDDDDSGVRILLPSFYAGDSHTIVLDLLVSRPGPVADVDVRFKDLVRLGNGTASSALALEAGTAPRGPHELRVVASFVGHEVAGALDDAADAIERGDYGSARTRLSTVRALIDQARASVDGLASVSSMNADANLLDQFLGALDAATDPALVASSLHYAAARRIVIPQLQASAP
jgi:hypothetical protein